MEGDASSQNWEGAGFDISSFSLVPDVCTCSWPLIKSSGGEQIKQTVLWFQVDRNPLGDGQGFPQAERVTVLEGEAVLATFICPQKSGCQDISGWPCGGESQNLKCYKSSYFIDSAGSQR